MLQTPVLLLIFNRPEQTMQVLEQLRFQRPLQLFIAADGPRIDRPGEAQLCQQTRQQVLAGIDWPCEIKTMFRMNNVGCGKAVSTAINWFFEQVPEGIILEDDCVPDPTFFSFCSAMLARYRKDDTVLHINGSNFQAGIQRGEASYYFSRYAHIWGWATWRRAWQYYDFSLQRYAHASREGLNQRLQQELQAIYEKRIDTWDIQWFMSVWFNEGRAVTPAVSLIRNIGYGKNATHTKRIPGWFRKIVYGSVPVITHPATTNISAAADLFTANTLFQSDGFTFTLKKIIRNNVLLYNLYKRIS
ncbi:hypothetical protein [Chitinophaga nivalis]|uniref:Nucleotide-diphospho-sugar transferase n=1 Tax=Chitinophaga nivalis TaxID=2991709 RepID=A0ABT3IEQ2_9BACT|nr:hypothetical protein [Chitinophaga nivalis]MCW3467874.1 hypothetical protein [Chitinophaga nivalis]MCW3482435.1 hypothetical protein [Chitinophaga nivalis]